MYFKNITTNIVGGDTLYVSNNNNKVNNNNSNNNHNNNDNAINLPINNDHIKYY